MSFRLKQDQYRWAAACVVVLLWQMSPAVAWAGEYNAGVAKIDFRTSTPADVLRIFGEPLEYRPFNSQRGKLSPDNLPDNYVMVYPHGLEVAMSHGEVDELAFYEPSYAFRDAVQVGSMLDEVLDVVGQPLTTMVGHSGFCHSNILYKNLDGRKGSCFYRRQDLGVSFRFRDYRVTEMCLSRPSGRVSHDYRWVDLSQADFSEELASAQDLEFNSATVWRPKNKLPRGFDPQKLLTDGMNPGLGVRAIHTRGITGRGVNVAMIDQPLCQDHPEFDGKIVAYHDVGCGGSLTSTHGPGMASLLVGTNCGTAPGAHLYYAAAPSWTRDAAFQAQALDWIIEQSAQLPDAEKIRVVSVSAAPSGRGSPFTKNNNMWDEACARAEAAGILVLDCTNHRGLISRAWYDPDDPENVAKCQPGVPGGNYSLGPDRICAPSCPRTKADQSDDDNQHTNGYTYVRQGGLSSSIPYTAGVLALGWQIRPELSAQEMRDILFHTAHTAAAGCKIINPPAFIDFVRSSDTSKVRPWTRNPDVYSAKVAQLDLKSATPADVRRIFGEPLEYRWMKDVFSPDNLPDRYAMEYPGNVEVNVQQGHLEGIEFREPNYTYSTAAGSFRIGSSLDEVIEALDKPAGSQTEEGDSAGKGRLDRDIEGETGRCYYARPDLGLRIWFRDYKAAMIYLSHPDSAPERSHAPQKRASSRPNDHRNADLRQSDFSDQESLPEAVVFNQNTLWPPKDKMPANADPQKLLQDAMNPGLGIRAIHERGITGKGINVAIIDQPLRTDHPEFEGRIAAYLNLCDERTDDTSMHGPAVASLLVGTQCGAAPGAKLYFAAAPSWTADSSYYARALDWIIEQSAQLPDSEKIRAVSVSAAPSGRGSPFKKNNEMWDEACARAKAAGILVLDCSNTDRGIIGPCWYDPSDPEDVAKCTTGFPGSEFAPDDGVCAPCSHRTTAEQGDEPGQSSYIYWGRGGMSWSIPYATGVLALGWQIRPDLSGQQMRELLFQSAYTTNEGSKVINPKEFIRLVKKARREF